ncbi:DoxX family protein [Saccharopolyspora shandongensis]|uniref:DoxX family protein n=1 Tax=Saccharopolyspora shandongensis TaxID=418495 RepID=UPI00343D546B
MNIVLWIVQAVLAVAFLAAGTVKLVRTRTQLVSSSAGMAWAGDQSEGAIKGIGALEVLAALGLILPAWLGIAAVLTPLAATGVLLLMIGAVTVHLRRGEKSAIGAPLVLGTLALVVAVLRFGPYAT